MINTYTDANIPLNEEKGVSDVCLAIEQMKEEYTREYLQNLIQGFVQQIIQSAQRQTKITILYSNITNLMYELELSVEQCMDILKVSEEDREELYELLGYKI